MKVIFLDVDGVLNCETTTTVNPEGFTGLDSDKIHLLGNIVEATGAQLVLSSTWRTSKLTTEFLVSHLRERGMDLIGLTKSLSHDRGTEIKEWLSRNPKVTQFVILDDNSDMGDLISRLVQTDCQFGLQRQHCDKAIAMLL